MSDAIEVHQRRYRRRILGVGAALFVVTFFIGALVMVPWVQNDLTDRVEDELSDAGISGVTASFSGQDGTLTCGAALDDPDAVIGLAEGVWGVRTIDLDRTCVSAAAERRTPSDDTEGSGTADDDADGDAESVDDSEPPDDDPVQTATTDPTDDTLAEIIAADPEFSQLAGLVESSGLAETLDGEGPVTLLAPTDAAFDAAFETLGSDAFQALADDPDALRQVLLHHAVAAEVRAADLTSGAVEMLDGSTVEVTVDGAEVTFVSGDVVARPVGPPLLDVEASNGVLHGIDRVLLPTDLQLGDEPAAPAEPLVAVFENGRIVLRGVVASDAQRQTLVAAALTQVDPANLVDELAVVEAAIPDDEVDRVAQLLAAMPPNLVAGTATLDEGALSLVGVHVGEAALAALSTLAADLDATLDVAARPDADADAAAELQQELNSFVAANPITFEPNSADLTAEALAVVEQVAAIARRLGAVDIDIVGHTDSDGQPDTNQILSELRAAAVLDALVAESLEADTLTSDGRGSSEPIVVDGVEDKDASRRVEFVVGVRT